MSRPITGGVAALLVAVGLPLLPAAPATAATTACAAPIAAAPTPTPAPAGFTPVTTERLLDTRTGPDPTPVGRDCVIAVDLHEVAAVPADATAVALNLTAVDAAGRGFVTAYPCGTTAPLASNLNPRLGDPAANLVVAPLDGSHAVCLFTSVATHLVVDLIGWFGPAGLPFHPDTGQRLVDTRTTARPDRASGPVASGTELVLPVAGRNGVPADAGAVAVNITVTGAAGAGFAVAHPCGAGLPPTSTVNFLATESRANHAYVGLSDDGRLCIFTNQTAELVVDLAGWFAPASPDDRGLLLTPRTAQRVVDTRDGTGPLAGGPPPGAEFHLDLSGAALADDTAAVVLNVVTTDTSAPGYVTIYPCGAVPPPTSSLNQVVGNEATNVVTVGLGPDRSVCGRTNTATHLVVDLLGTYGAGGPVQDIVIAPTDQVDSPALNQPFDPGTLDYTVRCPESGPLDLPVDVRVAPGLIATILSPAGLTIGEPGIHTAGHAAPVADDAVTVRVTRGEVVVASYSIRCLPHDFPTLRTTLRTEPGPGWFLSGTAFGSTGNYVMILDDHGTPVWYRRTSTPVFDVRRTVDGNLAWSPLLAANLGFGLDPTTTYVEEALDGTQVRSYSTAGSPTDHHDLVQLPGGHALLLTYELEQHVVLPGPPACADATDDVWWSTIQELDNDGLAVWTWRSRDHLSAADSTYLPLAGIPGCDLQHADSLDVAANGDVIVSLAHLDTVLRIRRNPGGLDDGQIVWRLGGPASTFTFLDDPLGGPARQHDARLSADGAELSLVDNRTGKTGQRARAVIYRLDTTNSTARLVFAQDHSAPLTGEGWSAGMGSVRRQADGHVVVGWGDQTMPQLTEFDTDDTPVLSVDMIDAWSYRTVKVPADAFDRDVLRATAGPP